MINKEEREAIDILTNSIADFVIGDYCERCSDFQLCEGECYFNQAIDTVENLINKQDNRIKELEEINEEHQKLNGELQKKLTEYEKQLDLDYVEENYVKKSVFLNLLKENGELKDRLIIAEEICKGKSIQELGMSDLYKED